MFFVASVVFAVVAGLDTIKSTAASPAGATYKEYQTVRPACCMLHS